jgi:stage II sporulation protein D
MLAACAPRPLPEPVAPVALPRFEPTVRVGLVVDTSAVELSSTAGFTVHDGSAGNRAVGRVSANENRAVRVRADGSLELMDGTRAVASGRGPFLFRPARGSTLNVSGRPYRGDVLVQGSRPGRVTAINVVELETYLLGVVPHEIGRVGEDLLQAAKAQAVAARTYAVAHRGRREALGFDYFATVQDQVYGGSRDEHDVTNRAVRETAGEVLLYGGVPIEAYYHSTCAGRTAALEEVWDGPPRPYLVSVADINPETGQAYDHFSSRFEWSVRWSADELAGILRTTLADSLPAGVSSIGEIRDMRVLERTPSGRVARMRIETSTTTFHVGRDRVRWILLTPQGNALNSSLFEVTLERDPAGRVLHVIADGGGWGHGIGMCQVGAMGRARHGQDYRTILSTYYPGTQLRRLY